MDIHFLRVLLAGLSGFVASMVTGGILFAALPGIQDEFKKYPGVYRDEAGFKKTMPIGLLAMFVAMLALAALYAHMMPWESHLLQGLCFGILVGVFSLGSSVLHDHMLLNVGWGLTIKSGIAYFLEWVAAGVAIGLIYH